MPKLEIATASYTEQELAAIAADFSASPLASFKLLFGGYSCANYRIDLQDGSVYVLKITTDYTPDAAERMCRTTGYLETKGYKDCCLAVPLLKTADNKYEYVSLAINPTTPAFLLTFSQGVQADKVMRDQPQLASTVLKSIGAGLARMHTAAAGMTKDQAASKNLRYYETDGGCCDLQLQFTGVIQKKIDNCAAVQKHPFVSFYKTALAELQSELKDTSNNIEMGIIHGDPFADNVLVDPTTGQLCAFIDIEDICVGPLLFDLACCAIGSTFDDATNQLHLPLLEALLEGYCSERKLPPVERDHLVGFMRLALCCNGTWRFCKFNVNDEEDNSDIPEEAKNSYLELQRRHEVLGEEEVKQNIEAVLKKCCS